MVVVVLVFVAVFVFVVFVVVVCWRSEFQCHCELLIEVVVAFLVYW